MAVTVKDSGYNALVKRVIGMKPVTIRTGILEKDGAKPHGVDGDDSLTVIQIAVWNHFGTTNADGSWRVPPRPFITSWFDAHEGELRKKLVILMRSVIAGKRTREEILNLMGQYCVGQIQQEIADGVPPPNAPSTISKKGSSTPLVDHGVLRSSISYDIQEGSK